MTTFDKREQGFEAKLAHDEALEFRAIARRDKKFGLWAAEKLGKSGAEAEAYASALVSARVAGDAKAALDAVRADLDRAAVALSAHQIDGKLDELMAEARAELARG